MTLAIRSERIVVGGAAGNQVTASVVARSYLGARNLLVLRLGDQRLRIETTAQIATPSLTISLPMEAIGVYPR